MATAPARYLIVGTGGATQPAPGGVGMTALSAVDLRCALSKIDADGVSHFGFDTAPVGSIGQLTHDGVTYELVIGPPTPIDYDYWVNVWGTNADAALIAGFTGELEVWLPTTSTEEPASSWVTGSAILEHVRNATPTPSDIAWADACAAAVTSAINNVLGIRDVVHPDLPIPAYAEISTNALTAGSDCYRKRDAPNGITQYADFAGAAIRLARDYIDGIRPQLNRWRHVADGIA